MEGAATPATQVLRALLSLLFLALPILFFINILSNKQREPTSITFYSNQLGDNLASLLQHEFESARRSIWISIYDCTDKNILELLDKRAREGLAVSLSLDQSASFLPLSGKLKLHHPKVRGLMHEKICLIDEDVAWIGSTNLTPTSLWLHANLLIRLESEGLIPFLLHQEQEWAIYEKCDHGQRLRLYHLPEASSQALEALVQLIDRAEHEIDLALFTFTHPLLADRLLAARERGVRVRCFAELSSLRGASRLVLLQLASHGIEVRASRQRDGLMHHKWMVVDGKALSCGSANWTEAAFAKNRDLLMILSPLSDAQKKFFSLLQAKLTLQTEQISLP